MISIDMIMFLSVVMSTVGLVAGPLLYIMYRMSSKNDTTVGELTNKIQKINGELGSVRVKHGQTWETFVPLMSTFEKEIGPKQYAVFLGQPIDLIYFMPNEIVFVEVKTGNSKLSQRQRIVKHLVKEKKIRWVEVNDSLPSIPPRAEGSESLSMTTDA